MTLQKEALQTGMAIMYRDPLVETAILLVYSKCSKILNNFLFLYSKKKLVFRAGIHKMFVKKISNREDSDQTASHEAIWSGSALFV